MWMHITLGHTHCIMQLQQNRGLWAAYKVIMNRLCLGQASLCRVDGKDLSVRLTAGSCIKDV